MAALMTSVVDWTSKVAEYIAECKKIGIKILPPDINESIGRFSVDGDNIRFGLGAVKNVGWGFIRALVKERERGGKYKSLTEFVNRMDSEVMNKRCVESLIKAGAFDGFGGRRSQYNYIFDKVMNGVSSAKKRNAEGQLSLFEALGEEVDAHADNLPDIAEFPKNKLLADEKEVLGIYVSGHPVSEYEQELARVITNTASDFVYEQEREGESGISDGAFVTVGGIVSGKSVKYTRNNEAMAFVAIEDMTGMVEVVVFPKVYEKNTEGIVEGKAVVVKGRAQVKEEQDAVVICNEISFLAGMAAPDRPPPAEKLWLKVSEGVGYDKIMDVLKRYRGGMPVVLYDERTQKRNLVGEEFWINPYEDLLLRELKGILGDGCVVIK
jgi:DNA polymerase-3 subunit alpha